MADRRLLFPAVGLLALAAATREGRGEDTPGSTSLDCGTTALHVMARLEGCRVGLDQTGRALGRSPVAGFTMRDLQRGATTLGLHLVGAKLDPARRPDRPLLASLDQGPHGHYVVVRPVGHTGRLVQVVDGLEWPDVVDFEDFQRTAGWRGLALLRPRPTDYLGTATALAVVLFIAGAAGRPLLRRGVRPVRED